MDTTKADKAKTKLRRMIYICATLIMSGSAMTATGFIYVFTFLKNIQQYENLTADQIIHRLILPHIMLLCGLAFLAWGFILVVRQTVIQSRIKPRD